MADCKETRATTSTPFLSALPLELRSYIYSHLLVASQPIKGPLARSHNSERYSIHTAILRTCKQINLEARQIFFGRNSFCISSVPPVTAPSPPRISVSTRDELEADQEKESEHEGEFEEETENLQDGEAEEIPIEQSQPSGAFEPPLQISDLQFVRHLEIDLLYYPRNQSNIDHYGPPPSTQQQNPAGADRYITNLSHLLTLTKPSLSTLALTFDTRPHLSPQSTPLDLPLYLTGPSSADTSTRFKSALSALSIPEVALRFEFPEARFDFTRVKREVLAESCLVSIVGQVLMARSEIGIRGVLEEIGEEEGEEGVRGV